MNTNEVLHTVKHNTLILHLYSISSK